MEPSVKKNSLTYSLADQSFARTKSVGILNVSVDLLQVLARRTECERLTVLTNHSLRNAFVSPANVTTELHDVATNSSLGRIWWDQLAVYSTARRTGNEWLFLPKGFASFARRCPVRLATLIHDMMQDHYDRHYPDAGSGFEAAYFRAAFRASLRQSEIIFTPTEFIRHEIERVAREKGWRIPRLVCCGEGFNRPILPPAPERRDLIVLTSRFPHKLTHLAVKFLSRWHQENHFTEQIHWIGSFPEKLELPVRPGWQQHARLHEAEFRALMARARAVLFFSDYEGFGRPPVETILAGACPVYSDIPATREVMDGSGCPFDNANYESFATALHRALATKPEYLQTCADKLFSRHNWDIVADRIVTALFGVI